MDEETKRRISLHTEVLATAKTMFKKRIHSIHKQRLVETVINALKLTTELTPAIEEEARFIINETIRFYNFRIPPPVKKVKKKKTNVPLDI